MKKVIIAACLLTALTTGAFAQEVKTTTTSVPATTNEDDNKTKVDPASLPDAVKATLAGEAYKGWTVNSAWLVKADPAYYTVELKNGDKTTSVNIYADGKVK